MVRITEHGYISDRYDDPDSTAGSEYRIYFSHPLNGLDHARTILGLMKNARIYCSIVCELPRHPRAKLSLFALPETMMDVFGRWRGQMLFHKLEDVDLYLMSREPFDPDKLMVVIMRAPSGCLK